MKALIRLALLTVFAAGLVSTASFAEDAKTVTGKVVCGKCTLQKAAECQNMLVTDGEEYYLAKNDAAAKVGHVCKGEKKVKATGSVAEKDGKKWFTATAMEEIKG